MLLQYCDLEDVELFNLHVNIWWDVYHHEIQRYDIVELVV